MKTLTFITITALILLLGYQTFIIRTIANDKRLMKKENQKITHHLRTVEKLLTSTYVLENTQPFTDSIFDEKNNIVSLKEMSNNEPTLIFRFSRVNCSECIIEQIDIIKEFTQKNNIKYLMVCDYNNIRELGLFKRTNGIIDPVFDCSQLLINEVKTPCFFIYSKGNVVDVFFPDDDFTHLTKAYLNIISEKYFL